MKFFVVTALFASVAIISAEEFTGCARSKFGVFANPTDCTKYTMCVSGAPVSVNCPLKMKFDARIGTCSPFAKCRTVAVAEEPRNPEPVDDTNMPVHEEPMKVPEEEPVHHELPLEEPDHVEPVVEKPTGFVCARANGLFADVHNCRQFYQCDNNGEAELKRCPMNFRFSRALGMCLPGLKCVEEPKPVEELERVPIEEPFHPREEPKETIDEPKHEETKHEEHEHEEHQEPEVPEEPTIRVDTVAAPFTCKKSFGIFADPQNCGKYFVCVARSAYSVACPSNSKYDFVNRRCVASNVRCMKTGEEIIEEQQPAQEEKNFECPAEFGFYPHSDCRKFVQCSYGQAHEMMCPANTEWDQNSQACDHMRGRCAVESLEL